MLAPKMCGKPQKIGTICIYEEGIVTMGLKQFFMYEKSLNI